MELFSENSWSQNTNQILSNNSMNKQLVQIKTREKVGKIRRYQGKEKILELRF